MCIDLTARLYAEGSGCQVVFRTSIPFQEPQEITILRRTFILRFAKRSRSEEPFPGEGVVGIALEVGETIVVGTLGRA
jgi:hypothetical protein